MILAKHAILLRYAFAKLRCEGAEMKRLENKVAVVTGAGGGLGRGICCSLAEAGASVVVSDLDLATAEAVAGELMADGYQAFALQTDVTKRSECEQLYAATIEKYGTVDILVCNAGVDGLPTGGSPSAPLIENVSDDEWDDVMNVNLKGVFLTCRAFIPHFKQQAAGRIVNISSVAGRQGMEILAPYAASKAAVISLTQSLALQLAPFHVNANSICPGIIWTPMWNRLATFLAGTTTGDVQPGVEELFDGVVKQMIPFGNPQEAKDIGDAVVFLSAPESKEITGQALNVCGGIRMN